MADTIRFDPDEMTVGDVEDFEDYVGDTWRSVFAKAPEVNGVMHLPAKAVTALVWITRRRTDETFTLDDARARKMKDVRLEIPDKPRKAPRKKTGGRARGQRQGQDPTDAAG